MYRERERGDGQLRAPESDVASDEHEEQSKTSFSSRGPLPPVETMAGPVGPAGATASDRAYGGAARPEPVAEQPAAEAEWVVSARMYNDHHETQVAEFDQRTDGVCHGADGRLDPNLVADWQTQHNLAADGRVSPETVNATMSWLTPPAGWGSTSGSTSSEDDAETMRKLKEAADASTQLSDNLTLS